MKRAISVFAAVAAFAVAGWIGSATGEEFDQQEQERAALLLRFDTNQDGAVSRAEMDAGIKAEMAAADTDGDGKLTGDERRAINEQRASQGQNSPLLDWNADGFIDYREFSNVLTTMFGRLDEDTDNQVSESEFAEIQIEAARRSKAAALLPNSSTPQSRKGDLPVEGVFKGGGY